MDVFVARQPIFDKKLNIFGYELLYRHNSDNFFAGIDDDIATSELIKNAFMVMEFKELIQGKRAFINVSKKFIESEIPLLLPEQNIVIEIIERGETTQTTIDACKKLKSLGYIIALDDFVLNENSINLIPIADIIKIEFTSISSKIQHNLIKKFKSKVKFLAEKIETREQYKQAAEMGYEYFQGYFFSKPTMISAKEIVTLNTNIFCIIDELNKPEPNYDIIQDIVERDLGLAYKLLKLVNTVQIEAKTYIKSIRQALSYLGINKIYHWISIIMLKDMENTENAELIKVSLIRGKLMELIAAELDIFEQNSEYFFTGIFSYIDVLLNKEMELVLENLPIASDAKRALLGEDNDQRRLLDIVINFEIANWDEIQDQDCLRKIGVKRFMDLYIIALMWANNIDK